MPKPTVDHRHVVVHPDARDVLLAPRETWPENGIRLVNKRGTLWCNIHCDPNAISEGSPWIMHYQINWSARHRVEWTAPFSINDLHNAFMAPHAPKEYIRVPGLYSRSSTTATFPPTSGLEVCDGDPHLQMSVTREIHEAIYAAIESTMPRSAAA